MKRDVGISPKKALPDRSWTRRLGGSNAPAESTPWKRLPARERNARKDSEAKMGAGDAGDAEVGGVGGWRVAAEAFGEGSVGVAREVPRRDTGEGRDGGCVHRRF